MANFCPWCGTNVSGSDAELCPKCGKPLREVSPGKHSAREAPAKKRRKIPRTAVVAVAGVVVFAGVFGVLFIGGSVDFDVGYDNNIFVLENRSSGSFSGFTWVISDEDGNVITRLNVSDTSSVIWTPPESTMLSQQDGIYGVSLIAHSILGFEQTLARGFGEKTYTVNWSMNESLGEIFSVTVSMYFSEYREYRDFDFGALGNSFARWPGLDANEALVDKYVNAGSSDHVFRDIVDQLVLQAAAAQSKTGAWTAEKKTQYLMGFVQGLDGSKTYKTDSEINKQNEYWSFPLETLYHKGGDCEDLSILLMALVRGCMDGRVKTALALYFDTSDDGVNVPGHAMATVGLATMPDTAFEATNVYVDELDLSKYTVDRLVYYPCETTSTREVGWIGTAYSTIDPILIVVP